MRFAILLIVLVSSGTAFSAAIEGHLQKGSTLEVKNNQKRETATESAESADATTGTPAEEEEAPVDNKAKPATKEKNAAEHGAKHVQKGMKPFDKMAKKGQKHFKKSAKDAMKRHEKVMDKFEENAEFGLGLIGGRK